MKTIYTYLKRVVLAGCMLAGLLLNLLLMGFSKAASIVDFSG